MHTSYLIRNSINIKNVQKVDHSKNFQVLEYMVK